MKLGDLKNWREIEVDSTWLGEVARLVVIFAIAMEWWHATHVQEMAALGLLSVLITGLARGGVATPGKLAAAGTSMDKVNAAANPNVAAQLQLVGPDAVHHDHQAKP
jgi:hypothetical protein